MYSTAVQSRPPTRCWRQLLIAGLVAVVASCCNNVCARPMLPEDAKRVVRGWLRTNREALGIRMNRDVVSVNTYAEDDGTALYHVVCLKSGGFVIISADDEIEPIIAFADDGVCELSPDNPLFVLVTQDIQARMRRIEGPVGGRLLCTDQQSSQFSRAAQCKWHLLTDQADVHLYSATKESPEGLLSDIRVHPLLASRWSQGTAQGYACYNYFTPQLQDGKVVFELDEPDNYPCGCVATAIAQLLHYHRYPEQAPAQSLYAISVGEGSDGPHHELDVPLLGGDFEGGPYDWDAMPAIPTEEATEEQRQAVGALCADAGAAVHMTYGPDGSGTNMDSISPALRDTFLYSNAVLGINRDDQYIYDLSSGLESMMNPNLDAGYPVILCVFSPISGHAIVADGYGYNYSSAYYHLNMGWSGADDTWYNLPHVNRYSFVGACIYNVSPQGDGEIISGRVTDRQGRPVSDATVTLTEGTAQRTAVTNGKGIYAFTGLKSESTCKLSVGKPGHSFMPEETTVATGRSIDSGPLCGNVWAVEFTLVDPDVDSEIPDGNDDGIETVHNGHLAAHWDWTTDWVPSDAAWTSPDYSIQSRAIADRESSSLSITLDCQEGRLSFYCKVSCEAEYDGLIFSIDGRLQERWSGEQDWQYVSFPVRGGRRTFEWEYSKDFMLSRGHDCAWLDDIAFPIARP